MVSVARASLRRSEGESNHLCIWVFRYEKPPLRVAAFLVLAVANG